MNVLGDFISAADASGYNSKPDNAKYDQAISAKCSVCGEEVARATIHYGSKPEATWECSKGHVTRIPWYL